MLLTGDEEGQGLADVVDPDRKVTAYGSTSPATQDSSRGPMVHVLNKGSEFGADGDQEWATRVYDKNSRCPGRVSGYAFNPQSGEGAGSYDQSGLDAALTTRGERSADEGAAGKESGKSEQPQDRPTTDARPTPIPDEKATATS